jgi:hypothetical protein
VEWIKRNILPKFHHVFTYTAQTRNSYHASLKSLDRVFAVLLALACAFLLALGEIYVSFEQSHRASLVEVQSSRSSGGVWDGLV